MINNFLELPLKTELKDAIFAMDFTEPTSIQKEVIPLVLNGSDVVAEAPTGSGKTCAFGIPILEMLDTQKLTLILSPTRELAIQITEELKRLAQFLRNVNILPIYGGQNIERQMSGLRRHPSIIVGTPGRIIDHLERKTLKLDNLSILVLDEADEMLNMGFKEDIDLILRYADNAPHQTILFSATMPKEILKISASYQKNPIHIKIKLTEADKPNIEQCYVVTKEQDKFNTLTKIIDDHKHQICICFCATKKRTEEVADMLINAGYSASAIHGDFMQRQRDAVMKRFRARDINILVATDVAARGIDVDNIEAVFNFDTPQDPEYYVHRIGRTARAKKSGVSYIFVTKSELSLLREYERQTKSIITELKMTATPVNELNLKRTLDSMQLDLKKYKTYIDSSIEEYNLVNNSQFSSLDLAAALLYEKFAARLSVPEEPAMSSRERNAVTSREKPQKSQKNTKKGSVRFFINLGKKDKFTEEKFARFLTDQIGLNYNDIDDIRLLDTFSFFEADEVNKELFIGISGKKFNNRTIEVTLAKADDGSSRSRNAKSDNGNSRNESGNAKRNNNRSKPRF